MMCLLIANVIVETKIKNDILGILMHINTWLGEWQLLFSVCDTMLKWVNCFTYDDVLMHQLTGFLLFVL